MRIASLMFALSLVAGCESTGLGTDDASVDDDMAVAGDGSASDLAGGPVTCDPIKQNCPDPAQKCTVVSSMGTSSSICVTPTAGMVQEGGTCMRATGGGGMRDMGTGTSTAGVDNCDKGLVCVRVGGFGGGGGGGGTSVCRKLCKAPTDCASTQKCTAAFQGSTVGTCQTFCTLFGTDCGGTQTCASFATDISSTQADPTAVPICRAAGNVAAWDTCMRSTDCGANTLCQQGTCVPLCDDSHACSQPPGDAGVVTCQPTDNLPNNGGTCG